VKWFDEDEDIVPILTLTDIDLEKVQNTCAGLYVLVFKEQLSKLLSAPNTNIFLTQDLKTREGNPKNENGPNVLKGV
jgi:hypothetical protein